MAIVFILGVIREAHLFSGVKIKSRSKLNDEKKALEQDWKAAKDASNINGNTELLYHVPCMER